MTEWQNICQQPDGAWFPVMAVNGDERPARKRGDPFDREVKDGLKRRRIKEAVDAEYQAEKAAALTDPFTEVNWDQVEDETDIPPVGPDGVFPVRGCAWVSGDFGSGKSMLSYWAMLMRVRTGQHAAICEAEMGKRRVKGVLRDLGATPAEMFRIHYLEFENDAVPDLVTYGYALDRRLTELSAGTLVYDSAIAFLAASGKSENIAADVREWSNVAVRPAAMHGRLVIVIDHTGHSGGRARGTSDKPAAGDVIIELKCTKMFKRGVSGAIGLHCTKDRDGNLTGSDMHITAQAGEGGALAFIPGEWANVTADVREGIERAKAARKPTGRKPTTRDKITGVMVRARTPVSPVRIAGETGLTKDQVRAALRHGDGKAFVQVEGGLWDAE